MINPKEVIPIHYGSIAGSYEDDILFKEKIDDDIEVKLLMEKE